MSINDYEITGGWEMYKAPFNEVPEVENSAEVKTGRPVVSSGSFDLDTLGDTFLNMSEMGKGIVFVNGHNLGRYWKVGPQQTLYVPGCWLKKQCNTITIFEQLNDTMMTSLKAQKTPILEDLKN